ncbi:cytosolic Fe-S cluster assembly factor nbp35 [Hypoxylon texense]
MEPYRRSTPPGSPRSWQLAKIALQLLSLVSCAIVLALSASWTWEDGSGIGILTIPISIATAAWTVAELITVFARRRSAPGRGIHPGAHVGVQLIIFLLMILALFYSSMLWRSVRRSIGPCNDWARDPFDPDYVYLNSTGTNSDGRYISINGFYCPEDYREKVNNPAFQAAVQALIAFCALLWAIHFALFIRACIETQRRNREPPAPMMYPQPMWPAPYGSSHPYGDPYGGDPQRRDASKEMNYA